MMRSTHIEHTTIAETSDIDSSHGNKKLIRIMNHSHSQQEDIRIPPLIIKTVGPAGKGKGRFIFGVIRIER